MKPAEFILISHPLCPYVQRADITLREKEVPFTRRDIDLANKPEWFLGISPLGKTPVLLVNGQPIFESAVICDYLDETCSPALHPAEPLARAQHRGWIEYASALLALIAGYYSASDAAGLEVREQELINRLQRLEVQLNEGPYFAGAAFSLVDAAMAPVFRYFTAFEQLGRPDLTAGLPRVQAWRAALVARESVRAAVPPDYAERLQRFLLARPSALAQQAACLIA
ncbi:glutathione S-transferase family protein [Chitinilyticum piscinae]|uniref:glutathione transferase n=1 Tax=Chitinilyticum piscinae TaxID=2866724 RepID=A0A8J7FFL4_9NEIS|nr:glutathione S-transferase family protein [Chitinilyticum piscinae]MBE9608110.1 glutathione S-transferase family protein [Chitinilyticum piscinae]